MFSTPQSKAFFSQQIIKGKLIAEQIQLVNQINERIWESKGFIQQLIKILLASDKQADDKKQLFEEKLCTIADNIENTLEMVYDSNQLFSFQVSLRNDIKHLEHTFFKNVMTIYEEKIKELKHSLLLLQHQVQQLQQKGLLPYVENPDRNNILTTKLKNYIQFRSKLETTQKIVKLSQEIKIQKGIISIVDSILHKKQQSHQRIQSSPSQKLDLKSNEADKKEVLNKSQSIYSPENSMVNEIKSTELATLEAAQKEKQKQAKNDDGQTKNKKQKGIIDLLELLYHWSFLINRKLSRSNLDLKNRIQSLSTGNKNMKQGIRNYKKIMSFEQNQALVRYSNGQFDLTKQQAVDFLRQMSQDLQNRFSRRNIYMVVSNEVANKNTKSCITFKVRPSKGHRDHSRENNRQLKQMDTNLNNSFLDQCSYLISDRFIADGDQNEQQIV